MNGGDQSAVGRPAAGADPLSASEARFRTLIEQNADGMVVIDRRGIIRFVNPAAVRVLGRSAADLLGREFGIPVVAGETTEVDVPRAGGNVRVAELRVVQTEWDGGPALLASLRDVSDRKRLEEELRDTIEALAEADRRKDQFLAMLSHELRNPLAPILNAVHVMRLVGCEPEVRDRMRDVVEQQVRVMARLVDDLLDVSRITRGKIQLRKEPVNLTALVHRAVETARPALQARAHAFSVDVPAAPVPLLADPLRIEQVLVNILNNAAKYTDPGGAVALGLTIEGADAVVRVRDTGIGIDAQVLPHVFDLFTQADHSLDRAQGGLGIGLTLVRSLVQMHGGAVAVRSEGLGRGSEFVVRLPLAADVPAEPPAPKTAATPRAASQGGRVLIIDDNVPSAESLALIVKLWGHDTRVAHSGPDALETAAAFQPDTVLLDIGMPGMDGYTVARRLRATPGLESATLIAMTGYGRDEDRRRSEAEGFAHHLVKPIDLERLEQLLARRDEQGPADARE
jgi:signal transduction histidine kinase/CheY-like chemotaxis protein